MTFLLRDKVRTTEDAGSDDWSEGISKARQWGTPGVVIRVSNSHGTCYLVRHPNGTEAWYEPEELRYR